MSVIVTMRLQGDPAQFEQYTKDHPEMAEIKDSAVEHGLIAHRFCGSVDGNTALVTDEWPDPESFQSFFSDNEQRIGELMQGAGMSPAGEPEFWRVLETPDKHGWEGAS